MPICRHLKQVAYCMECNAEYRRDMTPKPSTDYVGDFHDAVEASKPEKPALTQAIVDEVAKELNAIPSPKVWKNLASPKAMKAAKAKKTAKPKPRTPKPSHPRRP